MSAAVTKKERRDAGQKLYETACDLSMLADLFAPAHDGKPRHALRLVRPNPGDNISEDMADSIGSVVAADIARLLRERSNDLLMMAAKLDPTAAVKRAGPTPTDWSIAMELEFRTRLAGKQEFALAALMANRNISRASAFRAKRKVNDWREANVLETAIRQEILDTVDRS